jgi:Tol biopolymer transport system component
MSFGFGQLLKEKKMFRLSGRESQIGCLIGWRGRMPCFIAGTLLALAVCTSMIGCGTGSAAPSTPNPVPSVSTISPTSAPAGALAFMLTVNGSNFVPSSMVQWDGSSRTTTFVSSTKLQAHIMAADLATAGKVAVTVVNPAPGGGVSGGTTFTIAVDTIVFQSARDLDGSDAANTNSTFNIWIVNPDGSGATALTKLTAINAGCFQPAWSPDGSKVVFVSPRALDGSDTANTTENIWVMNADGSGAAPLTKLTTAGIATFNLAWSPDGNKIAFVSSRALDGSDAVNTNFTDNIWIMNADGSGVAPLTRLTAVVKDFFPLPAWSPDGSKIAFSSHRAVDGSDAANTNSTANIWVMNADGSNLTAVTKLTAHLADNSLPNWAPDSGKIAFQSTRALDGTDASNGGFPSNVWVINSNGTGATPVTRMTDIFAPSMFPVWSPDGSKIAFASRRALDGRDFDNTAINIWSVNADGSGALPLTDLTVGTADSGTFGPVSWSPNGNKLFFDSERALNGVNSANSNLTRNIWVVKADGSGAAPLTSITAVNGDSMSQNQP